MSLRMKNKFGCQIYFLVYKFNVCFIRLENLVYQNNPFIIYTIGQSSTEQNTQSTEYYKTDISKYISFSIELVLWNMLFLNPAYLAAFLFGLRISALFTGL